MAEEETTFQEKTPNLPEHKEVKDDFGRLIKEGDKVRVVFPNNVEHESRVFEVSAEDAWSQLSIALEGMFPGEQKPSTVIVSIEAIRKEVPGIKIHSCSSAEGKQENV